MDKKEISYEIIDYSGITNVKFYTSTDNGSYIPSHWHRAVEILYMQEGNWMLQWNLPASPFIPEIVS